MATQTYYGSQATSTTSAENLLHIHYVQGIAVNKWHNASQFHSNDQIAHEREFSFTVPNMRRSPRYFGDAQFARDLEIACENSKREKRGRPIGSRNNRDSARSWQAETATETTQTTTETFIETTQTMCATERFSVEELRGEIARLNAQDERAIAEIAMMRADIARQVRHVEIVIRDGDATRRINVGSAHKNFPTLVRVTRALGLKNRNVWIAGPAGSGKTTACEKLAEVLGVPFYAMGAIDQKYSLTGFVDARGTTVRTPFRDGYENGGVILLDECDASSAGALLELNAALANGFAMFPDGMVRRHADTVIVCAANTWGFGGTSNYVGRAKMDAAFMDRFVSIEWPIDEDFEMAIFAVPMWTRVVQSVRRAANQVGAMVVISPRASQNGADMLLDGMSPNDVVNMIFRSRYGTMENYNAFARAAEDFARLSIDDVLAASTRNLQNAFA